MASRVLSILPNAPLAVRRHESQHNMPFVVAVEAHFINEAKPLGVLALTCFGLKLTQA
jgi:hypothetical protein